MATVVIARERSSQSDDRPLGGPAV